MQSAGQDQYNALSVEYKAPPYNPLDSFSTQASGFNSQSSNQGDLFSGSAYAPIQAISQVNDLNNRFRTCGYICYKYTVLILAILGIGALIAETYKLFTDENTPKIAILINFLFRVFQICLFLIAFLSTHRKDLKKAQVTVILIKCYMGVLAILDIAFIIIFHNQQFEFVAIAENIDMKPEDFHFIMLSILMIILLIEEAFTALLLYGAIKIRNTLQQTHELLNENNYVYQP